MDNKENGLKNVKEIIQQYLIDNGYGGLIDLNGECECYNGEGIKQCKII